MCPKWAVVAEIGSWAGQGLLCAWEGNGSQDGACLQDPRPAPATTHAAESKQARRPLSLLWGGHGLARVWFYSFLESGVYFGKSH